MDGKTASDEFALINDTLAIKSSNITSAYFNDISIVYKSGGIKIIRMPQSINTTLTSGTTYLLFTLPEEYRPFDSFYKTIIIGSTNVQCTLQINSTGEVSIMPRTGNINSGIFFNVYEAYI